MTVLEVDGDEPIAVDALVIDVREAEVREAEVREVAPAVATANGALAQPAPEPDYLEHLDPDLDPEVEAAPRPHLRVAPDSYRRRRRVRIAAAAAAVTISVTLFAVVGFNVVLAQNQIELQTLQRELQTEQTRYYGLRNEVAQGSSPARIVSRASELGLVHAQPTYLPAPIKPPHLGPTDTAETLRETSRATEGSR